MDWTQWLVAQGQRLSASPTPGYASGTPPAAEPVAVAALAAITHGWLEPSTAACGALREAQLPDGSIGVLLDQQGPFWTTALAALAWRRFHLAWPQAAAVPLFRAAEERAIGYLLSSRGEKIDYSENVGHDTQLVGWPWVLGTHSWVEPTALAVLALRHAGLGTHPRTLEACHLLADRWLPDGGANYGNTFVLGQQLRPHVLPSAVSGLALSRCRPEPPRHRATLRYLRRELRLPLGSVSLGWTVLALLATSSEQADTDEPEAALWRGIERLPGASLPSEPGPSEPQVRSSTSDHHLNMLLLAAGLQRSPLLDMPELDMPDSHGG